MDRSIKTNIEKLGDLQAADLPWISSDGLSLKQDHTSILGVNLKKNSEPGDATPSANRFQRTILTPDDLRAMQRLAIALALNQPVLIEGGSGIGKTSGIERIAFLTNSNFYYANCHKNDIETIMGGIRPVGEWVDFIPGPVTKAILNGGILFLDEYNFQNGKVRGRLHEVIDAIIDGKEKIALHEHDGQWIKRHPDLRLVVAQNKPGDEFGDREVLDPAQFTRFCYLKEGDDLTVDTKKARMYGLIGHDSDTQMVPISEQDYLTQRAVPLTFDELGQIEGIDRIFDEYLNFTTAVGGLLTSRQIGLDEPQPVYLAHQRDFDRFAIFLTSFYDGDINHVTQQAIEYYFVNRFGSDRDKEIVRQLSNHVQYIPGAPVRRIELSDDITLESLGINGGHSLSKELENEQVRQSLKPTMRPKEQVTSIMNALFKVRASHADPAKLARISKIVQLLKDNEVIDVALRLYNDIEQHQEYGEDSEVKALQNVFSLLMVGKDLISNEQLSELLSNFVESNKGVKRESRQRMMISMLGGEPSSLEEKLGAAIGQIESPPPSEERIAAELDQLQELEGGIPEEGSIVQPESEIEDAEDT